MATTSLGLMSIFFYSCATVNDIGTVLLLLFANATHLMFVFRSAFIGVIMVLVALASQHINRRNLL
jgi:hypothetical protein